MKAAIYYGPKKIEVGEVSDAAIDAEGSILVEVLGTSICGSDLHLYRGAFDGIMKGGHSQTGHELVGTVVDVGAAVGRFRKGDRVTMAYSCSCGECYMCNVGQTAHCETTGKAVYGFGTAFGDLNGTHAEALVLHHADAHVLKVPSEVSEAAAITLSCNLPTAVIANRLLGVVPGEKVAVVGCGPTGLMALDLLMKNGAAQVVYALDSVPHRLSLAESKGAVPVNIDDADWLAETLDSIGGRGFDRVIEMVGSGQALQSCLDLIRAGGTIAALGVFPEDSFNLVLADVFLRDISLHMNGFANVQPFMWESLRLIEGGVVEPSEYFTHEFRLDDIDKAFATFDGKVDGANKMMIRP